MPDKFDNFIAGVQGGRRNYETMVNDPAKEKKPVGRTRKAAAASVTPEERKALDDIRNSRRGRKKPGDEGAAYKRVGFECREDLLESFDIIPYKAGKTRKELFEEALVYIIEKYS